MQTRRNFIATLGVAALGIASREAMASSEILAPRRKLKRIGLQLYTVRDLMKTDLPGTLSKVAAIGYKEVEFAGYFGRTPAQIRELLRRDGRRAASAPLSVEVVGRRWQKQPEDAKTNAEQLG